MVPANLERTDGAWRSGQGAAVTGGKPPSGTGGSGPGDAARNPVSDDDLARRREHLGASLTAKGVGRKEPGEARGVAPAVGYGQALRLSSEFIAGVAVGGGLGWFIDRFAGTSPWGMIVFLLLGFAAGVLNVLRSAGMVAEAGLRGGKRPERRDG
jgi:ATP synthase protein I